jgi:hypothetical protein
MKTLNREELAWAAGFADGEGSFFVTHNVRNRKRFPCFSLCQIDPQVLERFSKAVDLGVKVMGPFGPYKKTPSKAKPLYYYKIAGFEKTQALMALLWTWLGPVKRKQARSILLQGV